MGKLVLVVKIIYVLLMYFFELSGKNYGCCQVVIDGYIEIGKCCCEMGVDIIIVFDIYWLVNSVYYINCVDYFQGVYISNELLYFICDMIYDYDGNLVFGYLSVDEVVKLGVCVKVYNILSLKLEYGMLVLMCYMNSDKYFKVVFILVFCIVYDFVDSCKLGEVIFKVIEKYDGIVVVFVSGFLLYCFIDD